MLKSANIDLQKNINFGENCLHFIFKGKFSEDASKIATEAWMKEFDSNPTSSYVIIWDCLLMDGFEISARKEWVKCMNTCSSRISKVIVVSDMMAIRGASRLMLKLYSFESIVVKNFDELK